MRDLIAIPFALLGALLQAIGLDVLSGICDDIVEFIADDNPNDPAMKD